MSEFIRQQVYLLTAQNLMDHPVWEFCSDEEEVEGQDEATVRPAAIANRLPDWNQPGFIVAAVWTLLDGSSMPGYFYTGKLEDLGSIQPTFVTPNGQVNSWLGALRFQPDVGAVIAKALTLMGKQQEDVFPATLEVSVARASARITVGGFYGLDDDRRVVLVR